MFFPQAQAWGFFYLPRDILSGKFAKKVSKAACHQWPQSGSEIRWSYVCLERKQAVRAVKLQFQSAQIYHVGRTTFLDFCRILYTPESRHQYDVQAISLIMSIFFGATAPITRINSG